MSRRLAAALPAPLLAAALLIPALGVAGCCRPCAPRCAPPCGVAPCAGTSIADASPARETAPLAPPTTPPHVPDALPKGNCVRVIATVAASQPPPPPAPTPSADPAPAAATDDAKLLLQVHDVRDLVNGDEATMERLLFKVRALGNAPGGSAEAQGLVAIVVKAPRRGQALVESALAGERQPLRLKYFDVKDLIDAHPTLLDDVKPLLGDVGGRTIDLRNGTLIVRASRDVLDAVQARLEALRAPK